MKPLFSMTDRIRAFFKPVRPVRDFAEGKLSQAEQAFFDARDRGRIGQWGEEKASQFLREQGLKILARNERSRFSELDLIALDGEELVFAEVRCRRKNSAMSARDTVGPQKLKKIMRGAECYVAKHQWRGPVRADLIAIDVEGSRWVMQWIRYLETEESGGGCYGG